MPRIKGAFSNANTTMFGVAFAIFALTAACLGGAGLYYGLQARRLAAAAGSPSSGSTPAASLGFLDTATCCRYSHADLPALVADLRSFRRQAILVNGPFTYENPGWTMFQTEAVDLETVAANNTYLQGLAALRTRTLAVMAQNSDSLEDIQLRPYLNDLEFILNLTALDAYFMQTTYAYRRVGWLNEPWGEAASVLDTLASYTGEVDFAVKVPAWIAQLDAKATRWLALAQRSLAAGKVHANLTLVKEYNITVGELVLNDGVVYSLSRNYTAACELASLSGPNATSCFASAASLETKLAALLDWWTDVYMPAVAILRPDSAPGLRNVTNGTLIYNVTQQYYVGLARTDAQLEALAVARYAELTSALTLLAPEALDAPGATLQDLLDAYLNLSNTRFWDCSTNATAAAATFDDAVASMRAVTFSATGSLTDVPALITAAGYTGYYAGIVNASTGAWTHNAEYYFYDKINCDLLAPSKRAFPVGEYRSLVASDISPGRGLVQSALLEMDCGFFHTFSTPQLDLWQTYGPWRTGSVATLDGWALFADYLARDVLGAYDEEPVSAAASLLHRALFDAALVNDICIHGTDVNTTCTLDEARARSASFGLTGTNLDFEIESLLARPGYALGASSGEQMLRELRYRVREAIGVNETEDNFVRLFARFGQPDVARDFSRLVDVYLARANSSAPAVSATVFGADLIPAQFVASAGRPVVGIARDAACFVAVE